VPSYSLDATGRFLNAQQAHANSRFTLAPVLRKDACQYQSSQEQQLLTAEAVVIHCQCDAGNMCSPLSWVFTTNQCVCSGSRRTYQTKHQKNQRFAWRKPLTQESSAIHAHVTPLRRLTPSFLPRCERTIQPFWCGFIIIAIVGSRSHRNAGDSEPTPFVAIAFTLRELQGLHPAACRAERSGGSTPALPFSHCSTV